MSFFYAYIFLYDGFCVYDILAYLKRDVSQKRIKKKSSMAVLLKDLVPLIVDNKNDWRASLLKNWHQIIGSLATRVRLEKVTQDMVIVGVYESHWMQELYLLTPVMIDSINDFLGKPYIKQIRLKLVEDKEAPTRYKPRKKKDWVVPQVDLTTTQKGALDKITDPQLRDALVGFWMKCHAVAQVKK
jgi:hypothetical protein